ncbi:MAG: transglutaminaseTgpA domain-containing protein [Acidimicrobiales bacterium]
MSYRHPDRLHLSGAMTGSIAGCTALVLGIAGRAAAQGQLTPLVGGSAGVAVGLLAVLGLPSLSIRVVGRTMLGVSAAILVRFGLLTGSVLTGGQDLVLWLAGAVALLVLTDRVGVVAEPAATPGGPRPGAVARTVALAALAVLAIALVLAPVAVSRVGTASSPGRAADLGDATSGSSALRASDSLDMSQRPDLSDKVVFTVDTDRATFWRGQTFDVWDGRTWRRSDPSLFPLQAGDRVRPAADDLSATGDDVVRQRFRVEADFADVVYAAASPSQVSLDRPMRQRADGTVVTFPMGRGATYEVTSRRVPLSVALLERVGREPVPAEIAKRYAAPPVTTARVTAAAKQATRGVEGRFEQVQAIQDWMGKRLEYSLDAPLAPADRDVVDDFLFESKKGWCEQIASSLVVLARANGIPARLVTGYVPEQRDPVTGRFTVRERDAHAWAEVWFPKVGWVPFDPTADVPLAGEDRADPTVGRWLQEHAIVILAVIVAVVAIAGPLRRLVRRRLAARRRRPAGWAAVADARLASIGERLDRPRAPHETATSYATALAERLGDDRIVRVGAALDDALYSSAAPPPEVQAEVDALLAELAEVSLASAGRR